MGGKRVTRTVLRREYQPLWSLCRRLGPFLLTPPQPSGSSSPAGRSAGGPTAGKLSPHRPSGIADRPAERGMPADVRALRTGGARRGGAVGRPA